MICFFDIYLTSGECFFLEDNMKKTEVLVEISIFAALGWILDFIQGLYSDFIPFLANGGSIGIAMIAVIIISLRRGTKAGLATGLILGILDAIDGNMWISPLVNTWYGALLQICFDYIFAWMVVGLAGLFRNKVLNNRGKKRVLYIVLACLIGAFGKYMFHFLSGVFFWEVPENIKMVKFIYSMLYNLLYIGPSFILCSLVLSIIDHKQETIISGVGR